MSKRLQDFDIEHRVFEASDNIGGNWYHNNPNGMSACYQSLHIDTSKWRLAFEDFPVPDDWPDFPHHSLMLEYFHNYVDHFNLRRHISFNTTVEDAVLDADGVWQVTTSKGDKRNTQPFSALIVANGHHWKPRIPTEYPGKFAGIQMHSHAYDSPFQPHDLRGKRILVVGVGNSSMDIASELSQRHIAEKLLVSTRRGVWILPKYMNGRPSDKVSLPSWIPMRLGRWLAQRVIRKQVGSMSSYGLPEPDHEPLTAHPSVSGEFLTRVGSGDIAVVPGIERLEKNGVRFTDGRFEELDAIIWATGYQISFPFLQQPELQVVDNRFPLYRRMIKPGWPHLFFLGLAQPLPTLVNFAEQQSKYVAAVLQGKHQLPDEKVMQQRIVEDERKHLGHFYTSNRHTIQVDFSTYVSDLARELKTSGSWIEPQPLDKAS